MLSDSIILKKIQRQPKQTAGYKQLVRELGLHGDRVLVEVTNIRNDGRAEGRIVRPLNRAHPTVVGIFHYGSRNNYVVPIDQKISQHIVIPAEPSLVPSPDSGQAKNGRSSLAK